MDGRKKKIVECGQVFHQSEQADRGHTRHCRVSDPKSSDRHNRDEQLQPAVVENFMGQGSERTDWILQYRQFYSILSWRHGNSIQSTNVGDIQGPNRNDGYCPGINVGEICTRTVTFVPR